MAIKGYSKTGGSQNIIMYEFNSCIIRYTSRVKWSNPGNGVAPSPTPWKGSLRVALDYGCQFYLRICMSCVHKGDRQQSWENNSWKGTRMSDIWLEQIEWTFVRETERDMKWTLSSKESYFVMKTWFGCVLLHINSYLMPNPVYLYICI